MERLEPRARLIWALRGGISAVVVALVVAGLAVLLSEPAALGVAVFVGLAAVGLVLAALRYRRWRFALRDDALYLERGVVTHVTTVVPFVRIQHVDSRRGPIERAVGLASTVVYTAGARRAAVRIPGLTPARAVALRDRLRELAVERDADDAV